MRPRKRSASGIEPGAPQEPTYRQANAGLWQPWDRRKFDEDGWISGLELLTDAAVEMIRSGGSAATAAKLYRLGDALAGLGYRDHPA